MQAARLKQVDLEIEAQEESKEDTSQLIVAQNNAHHCINASQRQSSIQQSLRVETATPGSLQADGVPDYKAKILLFLEMEKLKLIQEATQAGIPEAEALEAFQEESLIDFDLAHFKEIIQ